MSPSTFGQAFLGRGCCFLRITRSGAAAGITKRGLEGVCTRFLQGKLKQTAGETCAARWARDLGARSPVLE